ncbi:MAG: class D sortase [Candidatus Acidiferrales bacterium]
MKARIPVYCGSLSIIRWSARILLLIGVILLTWCAYVWTDARVYETLESERLETVAASRALNPPPVPDAGVVKSPHAKPTIGSVLGRIDIPRIGVSVMVLEGDNARIFRRAAGHVEGTSEPGEPGNAAIAAHRDTFFRPLRNIRENDIIRFTGETQSYSYRVESVEVVGPEDMQILADAPQPTLTLITCYPFYYVGPAPKRFVVRAQQIPSNPAAKNGIAGNAVGNAPK